MKVDHRLLWMHLLAACLSVLFQVTVVFGTLYWYKEHGFASSYLFYGTDRESQTFVIYRETIGSTLIVCPAYVFRSHVSVDSPWWVAFNLAGLPDDARQKYVRVRDRQIIDEAPEQLLKSASSDGMPQ